MRKANTPVANGDRFVTKAEVLAMFGNISQSTLYRWIKERRFPRQVRMGPNRMGFLQSELDAHMAQLTGKRDAITALHEAAHREVA